MSEIQVATKASHHELSANWLILVTSLVGVAVSSGSTFFYSIGLFFESFQQQFGWSRGQISGTLLYVTLGLMTGAPIVGWLIDRFGARRIGIIAVPVAALTILAFAYLQNSLPMLYVLSFLTGFLGSGTTPITYTRVVNSNFSAARGLALGIILTGTGFAALVLPPLLAKTIAAQGWQSAFVLLAGIVMIAWPLVLIGFKDTGRGASVQKQKAESGVSRKDALTSRVFWTIAIGFVAVAMAVTGMVVHLVPLLRDSGMTQQAAASMASMIGIGVIVGRVVIGWLIDRTFAPRVAATVFVLAAAAALMLGLVGADVAPISAFIIGFALGAEVDLIAYFNARYFGMRNYGFIYGVTYAMFTFGAAMGPAMVGKMFDAHGNYQIALWVLSGCLLVGALAMLSLPRFPETAEAPA